MSLALYAKRCAAFKREVPQAPSPAKPSSAGRCNGKSCARFEERAAGLGPFRHVSEGLIKRSPTKWRSPRTADLRQARLLYQDCPRAAAAMTYNRTGLIAAGDKRRITRFTSGRLPGSCDSRPTVVSDFRLKISPARGHLPAHNASLQKQR